MKKNKSLMDQFKNRLATAEHKRRDLECKSMESIQIETQRGKRIDKTCMSIRDIGHTQDLTYIIGIPERTKSKNVHH